MKWPFDSHKCTFEYASHTKDVDQMKFVANSGDTQHLVSRQSNWIPKNVSIKAFERRVMFSKYKKFHPAVIIELSVQRKSEGFKYQVVIPAIIISMSNIVFLSLEPKSYERIVLFVFNILSNFTYIEQLRWMLPHDGQYPPNMLLFFLISQFITVVLIFYSIFLATDSETKLSLWKLKTISDMEGSKIGKIFMISMLDKVESGGKWIIFMDRVTALVLVIVYGVMVKETFDYSK